MFADRIEIIKIKIQELNNKLCEIQSSKVSLKSEFRQPKRKLVYKKTCKK